MSRLADLVDQGYSDREIADILGVSARTVLRHRARAGLESKWARELRPCGTLAAWRRGCRCTECHAAQAAEVAAWRARYQQATATTALNTREHWTPKDDAFLMSTTLTNAQAARALGRTWGAVRYRRELLRRRQAA